MIVRLLQPVFGCAFLLLSTLVCAVDAGEATGASPIHRDQTEGLPLRAASPGAEEAPVMRVYGFLVLLVVVGGMVVFLYRIRVARTGVSDRAKGAIEVIGSRRLSPRLAVYSVRVEGVRLLICDNGQQSTVVRVEGAGDGCES